MDDQPDKETREAILERVRRRFDHIPADVSLADELIAERRREAQDDYSRNNSATSRENPGRISSSARTSPTSNRSTSSSER